MKDCLIIGSGISGACIARELSQYNLNTVIIEKDYDVANQATLANSAIVHSGHDPIPGTLKARFNLEGNRMYKQMSQELDIPFLECGGMVVATNEEELHSLYELEKRAHVNGLSKDEAYMLSAKEVREIEPNISKKVVTALYLPTTSVTYPLEAAIANIENAMDNGVTLETDTEVLSISKEADHFIVVTNKGQFLSKVVINATGVNAADVSSMIATTDFTITPRRGEYYVLDKDVKVVNNVIYPTPSTAGKGIIATPQYHGNTLIGPTSEETSIDLADVTTQQGLSKVKRDICKTIANVPFNKIIRSFAGSRPTPSTKDFIIEESNVQGFINVAGIESPGLTAAPAIAKFVVNDLISKRLELVKKESYNPIRKKVTRVLELADDEKEELFKKDARYAKIICRCESITEGEIVEAIHRNCGAKTITGVKNRVRAGAGRCQGGFCQPEVLKILARELNIDPLNVMYNKKNSQILVAKTKGELI